MINLNSVDLNLDLFSDLEFSSPRLDAWWFIFDLVYGKNIPAHQFDSARWWRWPGDD